jgi:hypothetical protein
MSISKGKFGFAGKRDALIVKVVPLNCISLSFSGLKANSRDEVKESGLTSTLLGGKDAGITGKVRFSVWLGNANSFLISFDSIDLTY